MLIAGLARANAEIFAQTRNFTRVWDGGPSARRHQGAISPGPEGGKRAGVLLVRESQIKVAHLLK